MKVLIVIDDAPYGTEKAYNALRLAIAPRKQHREGLELRVFLLENGSYCALPGGPRPEGHPAGGMGEDNLHPAHGRVDGRLRSRRHLLSLSAPVPLC